ncbi:MAG: hypothetical protein PVF49_10165 [Anaerolineales bacterium]
MPWKPRPMGGEEGDWRLSLPLSLATVTRQGEDALSTPVSGEWEAQPRFADSGQDGSWAPSLRQGGTDPPSPNPDEDDPSHWSVLRLMATLRGWVSRADSGSSPRPVAGAWGDGVLGDIKAAWMQTRVTIRCFVSDINLELRHQPDPESRNWLSVPPRTTVFWRGQIGYDDATGQPWYLVYSIHRGELYAGYVPAINLRPASPRAELEPSQPTAPSPSTPLQVASIQDELESLWRKLLNEQERRFYYQPWFDFQAEIEGLMGFGTPSKSKRSDRSLMDDFPPSLADTIDHLLHPAWLLQNGPAPTYLGHQGVYAISAGTRQALRDVIFYVYRARGSVDNETWGIIGRAFGITAADAFLQVLRPELWSAEYPATTESGLPLTMSVLPPNGVYLRPRPELVQNIEPAPFQGIPQGGQVTVVGDYCLLEGQDHHPQVFLLVEYAYPNGRTYRGWVPAEFLGTRLVSLTPEIILWEGAFNTFGYGQGVQPWQAMGYHTYGQPQFLNLRAVFRHLGWENWRDFPARHLNLCGPLATMESMNVSLEEGLRVFASTSSGQAILQDPNMGTSPSDLKQFVEDLGWQAEIHYGSINLAPFLASHQVVLALVASANGRVRRDGTSGHWVHILEVDEAQGLVRFYNPLFNQDQEVTLTEFDAAWERTDEAGITNVDRIFLTAHP